MRLKIIAIILLVAVGALAGCKASQPAAGSAAPTAANSGNGVDPFNKNADGFALRGYDAVAYFTEGKAVEGDATHEYEWGGAKWRFSSAAHRDAFMREPQKYAPQYGGFCSWAVGHGYTANGDPRAWKIVDGKLYLNYNEAVKRMWEQDIPTYVRQGDENWPRFLVNKPEHKG